ncbi:type II secretion system protein GspM [Pseudomonas sp. BP8]|uniref:type II secretion system protein GspM n=1 Tax=Pseudomonas sp. BP8 TaxID=2817864 RepID=UPI001AE9587D|nr:type II secretion system protein GspM [Pseudomonas sp. BP8]MBP2260773.1 type II secretion system protein M (XcpZ-type) [Pseudomonas sp. BP8]HDS1735490.1 type II secretion system protein GspM [Pseudomonas putida]
MNRASLQRYRLPLAWAVVVVLGLSLLVREGLAYWQEAKQWRALAESAASLHDGPVLALERLRQSAQARQIVLADVEALDDTWQLRGQVADEKRLEQWLLALQADGVEPLQWGLEQDGDGLRFALQVRP